ncbi:type VI secretion system tube protein TssD [Flavobacterium aestivum]|uniref:type VI secretion system tube protein TssD n=1 Tax=Flavobacterium aestivum TaxID=3003257 RepID=UPI0022866163|nr:type VI secretion system tube protein TssD [Flavobacterium aestivum]
MFFLGILKLDNVEYRLLSFRYHIMQPVDSWGKSKGHQSPFSYNVVIESDDSTDLLEWIISAEPKDGTFTFYKADGESKYRDINFKKAYCVSHTEMFMSDGTLPLYQFITISEPRQLLPKKPIVQPVKIEPQESKWITDIKWMCPEMKKTINKADVGNKVSLLVRTINYKEGETVSIIIDEANGEDIKTDTKEITFSGQVNADGFAELKKEVMIHTPAKKEEANLF